jgi:zinc protease
MKQATAVCSALLAATLVCAPVSGYAQTKAKTGVAPTAKKNAVDFKDYKLKNGLRVLLVEDHSAPVISLALNYGVGSRNEKQGRTGFAHLFEHMMFQGSANVGKSEHFIQIDTNGGQMNGTTNEERTLYFESLPSNQLDLMLFLESDRMKGLDITKENLDNQRNAVQEERRLGVDNQPYGKLFEQFGETMYDNFNYKHSVIGSMEDLNAASVEDVRDFFRVYYAPNNAVLALVGDFKTAEALAKIKQYFEGIPAQPMPAKVDATEPEQTAERRFTVEDPLAQLPLLMIGYKGMRGNTTDADALSVLATVLGSGQSSRLYQKLVKEKQLALGVGSFLEARRGPGAFLVQASVTPGKQVAEVEEAIYAEIAKLQSEPIADWELAKAKQFGKRSAINARQSSLGLAIRLVEDTTAWNDPNRVNTRLEKLETVTKEDVLRVAKQYLQAKNRTVGIAIPKPKGAAGANNSK